MPIAMPNAVEIKERKDELLRKLANALEEVEEVVDYKLSFKVDTKRLYIVSEEDHKALLDLEDKIETMKDALKEKFAADPEKLFNPND
jgi:hypothetical protein